jgi:hypothetical protein
VEDKGQKRQEAEADPALADAVEFLTKGVVPQGDTDIPTSPQRGGYNDKTA